VFDLGLGYQNPVSFTLSASVNPADVSMSVSSQGFVTATAGFLTDVTKYAERNRMAQHGSAGT